MGLGSTSSLTCSLHATCQHRIQFHLVLVILKSNWLSCIPVPWILVLLQATATFLSASCVHDHLIATAKSVWNNKQISRLLYTHWTACSLSLSSARVVPVWCRLYIAQVLCTIDQAVLLMACSRSWQLTTSTRLSHCIEKRFPQVVRFNRNNAWYSTVRSHNSYSILIGLGSSQEVLILFPKLVKKASQLFPISQDVPFHFSNA